MSEKSTGKYFERKIKNFTEISTKSGIEKMIEELERELQRIESKIAAICGGGGEGVAELNGCSRRYFVQDERSASKTVGLKEASRACVSELKPDNGVRQETEEASTFHVEESERLFDEKNEVRDIQDIISQRSDDNTDDNEWSAFIAERAAIPVNEPNLDLEAEKERDDCSSDTDDDWDDFCRERARMTIADDTSDAEEDFDSFFSEKATMGKYKNKKTKSGGKLRRLVRRIFGRH